MADEAPLERPVPPASEEVHLPDPTYLPVLVAFGVTLAVSGILFNYVLTGIGVVIVLAATIRWIRDTRRDLAELPLEH
jgi:hypothetical protein